MRKDEFEQVLETYRQIGLNVKGALMLKPVSTNELKGKTDPEAKRKTIGKLFIDVFQDEAKKDRRDRITGAGYYLS